MNLGLLQLSHWSDYPVVPRSSAQKPNGRRSPYEKPQGLWVSVDGPNDWKEWCLSENYAGLGGQRYRVCLVPTARIKTISSRDELVDFRKKYTGTNPWRGESGTEYEDIYIKWEDVAKDFQGIIIAPYQWECRLEEPWYYSWDAASGCIWDADAILSIEATEC
jgi:hypothetical protein